MPSGPDLFVVCKSCQAEVSPYITECPYCGTRLRKRAPTLDREGRPTEPLSKRRRQRRQRRAPRLRMPEARYDRLPYATLALVLVPIAVTIAAEALLITRFDVAIVGEPDGEWWRLATAPFVYASVGHEFVALTATMLFGWLLERRHGPVVPLLVALAAGAGGMGLAVLAETDPVALGGHGVGLGLLAAWAVPDMQALRRREETDSDMLGVLVIAIVLLLTPLAVDNANAVAGIGGGLIGLLLGLPLSRGRAG